MPSEESRGRFYTVMLSGIACMGCKPSSDDKEKDAWFFAFVFHLVSALECAPIPGL